MSDPETPAYFYVLVDPMKPHLPLGARTTYEDAKLFVEDPSNDGAKMIRCIPEKETKARKLGRLIASFSALVFLGCIAAGTVALFLHLWSLLFD